MSCKHCECQTCADERTYLERKYIKIILSLSTENRTPEQVHKNLDKQLNEVSSKYDVLYAETYCGRVLSVKFSNIGGHRDSFFYRLSLWNAKKSILSHIKTITDKKGVIVASLDEDILDIIPNRSY